MRHLFCLILLLPGVLAAQPLQEILPDKNSIGPSNEHPADQRASRSDYPLLDIGAPGSEAAVRQFLAAQLPVLGDLRTSLELQHKVESLAGFHFTFDQFVHGIRVFRSQVKVNTDREGVVRSWFDRSFAQLPEAPGNIPDEAQLLAFFAQQGWDVTGYATEAVYVFTGAALEAGLRAEVTDRQERHFEVIIDADGNKLYQRDLNVYHHAAADSTVTMMVFNPDPLTTAGVTYGAPYVDNGDQDLNVLNNQRVQVQTVVDYNAGSGVFNLAGPYVRITEHSSPTVPPVTSTNGVFSYTRSQSGFEDVNAYYHITLYQEHIQSLGFFNLGNYQLAVDVHALGGADQSVFTVIFGDPQLSFGEGGVDDAEDADVIIHEYAHALSYDAAPNTNSGAERTSLDEALGDYMAASYSRSINQNAWDRVFTWDGHNEFWNGRNAITNDQYPADLINNLHLDADIWASTLMQVWEDIGRDATDRILFQSMFSYAQGMSMTDAALLYLQADLTLSGGVHFNQACFWMLNRGLVSGCPVVGIDPVEATVPVVRLLNSDGLAYRGEAARLAFAENGSARLTLFDLQGRQVWQRSAVNSNETVLPAEEVPVGVHVLQVETESGTQSLKLVRLR